jgi:phospholipid/cholesterol/gamma-HCH transport system substrate-binding protein
VPALVADLGPTVRTLAGLEPRLDDLFSLVAPVTACVRDHALPVLNSKLDDGKLSSGQPVWEEILHTATGLTSSSQNFDGNGFNTRFSFGLGPDVVATGSGEQQNLAFGQYSGSRPTRPAQRPPFKPGAPCEDQALPDLHADAHQATTRTVAHLSNADLALLARALLEGRTK